MPVVLKQDNYEQVLELPRVSHREFERFARANPDIRIERTEEGKLIVMPPADAFSDHCNTELTTDLVLWNRSNEEPGLVFGPSAGFTLPNGATRSPDAAWLARDRWDALTESQRKTFAQIIPDLVVELMSPSDSLPEAQKKMVEYRANGVRLGLLIHRTKRTVYVYRPGQDVVALADPTVVSGEPEFAGLALSMERIF